MDLAILLAFYFTLGFTQSLPFMALQFFARDALMLSPSAVSASLSVASLPWCVKPAFGFLTDCVPVWGMRRKPYLVGASAGAGSMWVLLALAPASVVATICVTVVTQLCVVMADVVADSIVVERVHATETVPHDRGKLQSATWTARFSGSMLASLMAGFALEHIAPRNVFAINALPLLGVAVCALWYRDAPEFAGPGTADVLESDTGWSGIELHPLEHGSLAVRATRKARFLVSLRRVMFVMRQPNVKRACVFLFVSAATPYPGAAMFFFYTQPRAIGGLQLAPSFLAALGVVGNVCGIVGAQLYRRTRLRTMPLKKIYMVVTLVVAALYCTDLVLITRANTKLGIDDRVFLLGSEIAEDVVEATLSLPLLVMIAHLCPRGLEAAVYASVISVSNAGGMTSRLLGAGLARMFGIAMHDFRNLWALSLSCTVLSLTPLALLRWLPDTSASR